MRERERRKKRREREERGRMKDKNKCLGIDGGKRWSSKFTPKM